MATVAAVAFLLPVRFVRLSLLPFFLLSSYKLSPIKPPSPTLLIHNPEHLPPPPPLIPFPSSRLSGSSSAHTVQSVLRFAMMINENFVQSN